MNLAALWSLPVVFVCENNLYSEWTNYERLTAGAMIADRGRPFGIPSVQVDGTDVLAVRDAAAEAVRRARAGRGPSLIEARTYIHCGHMEGEEVLRGSLSERRGDHFVGAPRPSRDVWCSACVAAGVADHATLERVRVEERDRAEAALKFAIDSPPPDLSELTEHLWAEIDLMALTYFTHAIRDAIAEAMREDPSVYVFGEDIDKSVLGTDAGARRRVRLDPNRGTLPSRSRRCSGR